MDPSTRKPGPRGQSSTAAAPGAADRAAARPFDLVLFGATGFTGQLVAEVLARRAPAAGPLRWALAGRSLDRLRQVRQHLRLGDGVPLLVADAGDPAALAELVAQTRAVVSTVGPYQLHGQPLALACAQAGTDYLDLCGEPAWMAQMIPMLQRPAQASGARIVFSCGFDSIPFDLGVVFLQDEALQRQGAPLLHVRARVQRLAGGLSGGTLASALATLERASRDPAVARTLADPFALTPGFRGPVQPDGDEAAYDDVLKSWTGPFMMAPINTKNVHRSNALRGHPWGRDFLYDERRVAGPGLLGQQRARAMARNARLQNAVLGFGPARALLRRLALPQPGQGPSAAQREAGHFEIRLSGETAQGRTLQVSVTGDRDPGYGSTSRMLAEAALCLLLDVDHDMTPGGVWTPGAAMGLALVRRLQAHAGLLFTVEV